MSIHTTELAYGDLCRFQDAYGIFLGVARVSSVVIDHSADVGDHTVRVIFLVEGESSGRISTLRFSLTPLSFVADDFTFIKLLINDEVVILPRLENHPGFRCDDGLELLSAISQVEH